MLSFIDKMHNQVSRRTKAVSSRCLKLFNKQESHKVKECGNCCCHLPNKALITGFSEIAKSKTCRRTAIKLIVLFLCTSGFFYQTWAFLQMYLAYPTILDVSEEYPDSFTVPAISICHKNRLYRQPFCKSFPEKCTWQYTTWESFCNRYRRMCPAQRPQDFNFGIPVFDNMQNPNRSGAVLKTAGPNVYTNVPWVQITERGNSSSGAGSKVVISVFPYNGLEYRCFSFFSLLIYQNKETFNMTITGGYTFLFDMHPEEYFNTMDLVQASVALHDPRKIVNPMTEGITLTAGKMYQLFPTIERKESLPPPYASDCWDYLTEWKRSGGIGPLSKDDCISSCKIVASINKYGCYGQTTTYANLYPFPICDYIIYETSSEDHRKCISMCPDACEENIYHVTAEYMYDLSGVCNETDEHCKSRYLFIDVNFNRMKIKKFKQIPRFESIELFSYIGGYLGMWLGISLAATFDLSEMIYDAIGYVFLKRGKEEKRGNTD